ncbi:MAG: AbrB/MazE/SpoVT family DNA-binding domain-containing protein [Burkholderiaceae bacterium]
MAKKKENLFVSSKGQITLPAAMRQALGLDGNAIVTAEQRDGRIVLTLAMVVETEVWSDAEVRQWARADEFQPGEREALLVRADLHEPARGQRRKRRG